jgi:hypothetical protein
MEEIQRTVISRPILRDHGYDLDKVSDEQLEIIADELMEYWSVSDGFKDALESTMKNLKIKKRKK